jgi:hypothetical protein
MGLSIERWWALKRRADQVVHDYLLSFQDDLDAIGQREQLDSGFFEVGRQYYCLLLSQPQTPRAMTGSPTSDSGCRGSEARSPSTRRNVHPG